MIRRPIVLFAFLLVVPQLSLAQLDQISKELGVGKGSQLSESKVASGLKEALRIGSENAVKLTGQKDGYFGNEAIKIVMPKNLHPLEQGLRVVGYGPKIDEFVLSMNRAAEAAAPAAKEIFADAILSMSIEDAKHILNGGDTAATDFFKAKTTDQLTVAFRPTVEKSMKEVGVTQQYEGLLEQYKNVPFARSPSLDINTYVVNGALSGLFYVLAEEEKKIRKDPAARVTSLLKQVFAK
jgi:Protein of unknown function (DUF4197)